MTFLNCKFCKLVIILNNTPCINIHFIINVFNLYYYILDSLDSGLDETKEIGETKDRRKKDKHINEYVDIIVYI